MSISRTATLPSVSMASGDVARLVQSIQRRVEAAEAKVTLHTKRESRHYDGTDALEQSRWPKGTWALSCDVSAHGRYVSVVLWDRYARVYVSGDDEVWVIGMIAAVQEAFEPYRSAAWLLHDLRVMYPFNFAVSAVVVAAAIWSDAVSLHTVVSRALVGAAVLALAAWASVVAAFFLNWAPYVRFRSAPASTRATGGWLLAALTVILIVEGVAQLLLTALQR